MRDLRGHTGSGLTRCGAARSIRQRQPAWCGRGNPSRNHACLLVGQWDLDLSVQPAGPHERGVQHIWPVGGSHQLDLATSGWGEEGQENSGVLSADNVVQLTGAAGIILARMTCTDALHRKACPPCPASQSRQAGSAAPSAFVAPAAAQLRAHAGLQQPISEAACPAASRANMQQARSSATPACLLPPRTPHLAVRAGALAEPLAADGINLVHEDDAGLVLARIAAAGRRVDGPTGVLPAMLLLTARQPK